MGKGLGDHETSFHPAGKGHDAVIAFFPKSEVFEDFFEEFVVALLSEEVAAEFYGPHDWLEHVRREFLRNETNLSPGALVVRDIVVTRHQDLSSAGIDDPADDIDEGGFPRTVGAQEGEDLTLLDGEVDVFQSMKPSLVGLHEILNFDDVFHGSHLTTA